MNDLISRQAAIDAYGDWYVEEGTAEGFIGTVKQLLEGLPSAQPKRIRGKWIPITNGRLGHECDQCHEYAPSYESGNEYLSRFCPNCGADMREVTT